MHWAPRHKESLLYFMDVNLIFWLTTPHRFLFDLWVPEHTCVSVRNDSEPNSNKFWGGGTCLFGSLKNWVFKCEIRRIGKNLISGRQKKWRLIVWRWEDHKKWRLSVKTVFLCVKIVKLIHHGTPPPVLVVPKKSWMNTLLPKTLTCSSKN